jgi:predicted nucleic acid-binding protein
MAYWDTSCLAKLYAPEADSAAIRAYVVAGVTIVTSEIARLELWATLRRKEAVGDLHPGGARQALEAYDIDVAAGLILVEAMSPPVIARFETIIEQCQGQTPRFSLRTLDAIHLSTAAALGESEVVATDRRLREAAMSLGFTVYPPP